jgi:hypothetical protein
MQRRQRDRLNATLVAVAIIAVLALVANPDLRALLLLTDSLGLDLLVLLLATQVKHVIYVLLPTANAVITALCAIAFNMGTRAIRAYPNALPLRPFDKLFCPALVFVTYGLRCRIAAK